MANNSEREIIAKTGLPFGVAKGVASGSVVAAPTAITSTSPSAGYVQAEVVALRTDVVNLRNTVVAMHTALVAAGLLPT